MLILYFAMDAGTLNSLFVSVASQRQLCMDTFMETWNPFLKFMPIKVNTDFFVFVSWWPKATNCSNRSFGEWQQGGPVPPFPHPS